MSVYFLKTRTVVTCDNGCDAHGDCLAIYPNGATADLCATCAYFIARDLHGATVVEPHPAI